MNSKNNPYILAKFDVSGIQSYIFATNRMRENIGASCQVTRILEVFLPDSIKEVTDCRQEYVLDWEKKERLCCLEDERIKAEIIYIGGGNAMVLFRDRQIYQCVCVNLGRKAAESCQGIYLAAAYIEAQMDNFIKNSDDLQRKLADNKANMIRQPICSPFPVVEQDNDTYQPITRPYCDNKEKDEIYADTDMTEMRYQKRESYQWLKKNKDKKLYPVIDKMINYDYPVEMEDLCRKPGEDSYIAVVHIDGNGMGRQIQEILHAHEEYAKAVPALRAKSKEISGVFKNTYKSVLLKLWEHKELLGKDRGEAFLFPLRPIVLDGDDFTFLCTADLAIPITVGFLTELAKSQGDRDEKITACAGIAFVHSHFPFYEAYRIAEESCLKAKNKWYKEKEEKRGSQENNYLDFRVLKGSEVGGIQRHEEWQMRPYSVSVEKKGFVTGSIIQLHRMIKEMEDKWPSNRLHKINQAMLEGEEQMKLLDKEFTSRNYQMKELIQTEDWRDSSLFDALELRGLCKSELLAEFLDIREK